MSVSTDTERIFRIGGYVKRAKLNLRNEREIRAFHRNAIERRFGDFEDGTLVDVYIDITGYKETAKRPEMLRLMRDCADGKVNLIFAETKGYLSANTREFCYWLHFIFNLKERVDIITDDDKFNINTILNADKQREALIKMKLNAVCWEKLGQQKYVEFLYHPVLEVIAVRSCNATNPNAVLWDETKKSGLQLCTSAFSNAVYDKLDWMRKYKFRFRGVTRVRGGEKIIFFFLDEPQILVGKDKKHLDAMDTSDSIVKYIPYKESECGEAAGLTAGIAYPENWQEQIGVSYEIKQQRGRVLDAVSSADIRNHGTKVVNPFIGVIPTHGELEDELEQIYEAM